MSPWDTSSVLKMSGDHLEKYQFTPKTGNQNIQPVRFWYKNANMPCYHHRASTCSFNQSRAEALPVECSGVQSGRGGRGHEVQVPSPPGSEHGGLVSAENRSKLSETPPTCLQMDS